MAENPLHTHLLISLARTGDRQALGALFERYQPGLYAIALRMLGYSDDARDAVQDAFFQALTKFDTLKDPQAFLGWLQAIVERACLGMLRRKRNGPIESIPHAEFHVRFEDLIEDKCCQSGLNHRIAAAFYDLPPLLQETAALRYFTELNSYEAIAETLSIPVGTVRSRLAEARTQLKKSLVASESNEDLKKSDTANAWENFYWDTFDQFFERPAALEQYYNHLERDLSIIFTSGKHSKGRELMLKDFQDDIRVGIQVSNHSILSTGKITVVDSRFINPPDHPDHCPPAGAIVHYHDANKTWQVRYHHAPRECNGPFGNEDERCQNC